MDEKTTIYAVLKVLEALIHSSNVCSKCGCGGPNPFGECECSYGETEPLRVIDANRLYELVKKGIISIETNTKREEFYLARAKAMSKHN